MKLEKLLPQRCARHVAGLAPLAHLPDSVVLVLSGAALVLTIALESVDNR
jgi:hypothetical protein